MPPIKTHTNMSNNNNINAKINGTQACAACKYQRRKCAPDCILAPYFPHDRQRQFLNAHKLFGVSNITKIIRNLNQPDKDEAMRTIIFQSDVRATDPVGGCYRIIRDLQRQIDVYKSELDLVYHHLDLCRAQAQAQAVQIQQQHHQHMLVPADIADNATVDCDHVINGDPLSDTFDQQISYDHHQQQQQFEPHDHDDQERFSIMQNGHVSILHDVNGWGIQESATSSSMPVLTQQSDNDNNNNKCDDDHIKPLLDLPLDRQEFKFESEDTIYSSRFKFEDEDTINEQSKEAILAGDKATFHEDVGTFQHGQHHDLKGNPTYFSLTNCNS